MLRRDLGSVAGRLAAPGLGYGQARRIERVPALVPDPQDAGVSLIVHEILVGEVDPAYVDDADQDVLADLFERPGIAADV